MAVTQSSASTTAAIPTADLIIYFSRDEEEGGKKGLFAGERELIGWVGPGGFSLGSAVVILWA